MSDDDDSDDDAPDGTARKLGGWVDPPESECPVALLGHHRRLVVFAMPDGQIREEKAVDIPRMLNIDIFASRAGKQFLNNWRDADDKFQRALCGEWFVRKCRSKPFWNAARSRRGLGVWPAKNVSAVLHRGSELWIYDREGNPPEVQTIAEAMRALDGPNAPLYDVEPTTPAPDEPSTIDDGVWVYGKLAAWRWEEIGGDGLVGADVLAGWIPAAMLGAVAPFRPHLLVYALPGSGKTTLVRFIEALLGGLGVELIDDFSAAGLRNDLAGKARPVLIDEAESSPDFNGQGPVEQALGLIRKMATGQGSTRKMGAIGGGTVTQTAVGAVLMAAVTPVKLTAADVSRVAELKLLPIGSPANAGAPFTPQTDEQLERALKQAKALAPQLLGRVLAEAERYKADVGLLKRTFRDGGLDPRAADLISSLAAGRRLLMFDDPLDAEGAVEEVRFWSALIVQRAEASTEQNTGEAALMHLLAWPSTYRLVDRIVPFSELVHRCVKAQFAGGEDVSGMLTVLRENGMIVDRRIEGGVSRPTLIVANKSPNLETIFAKTPWRDWKKALAYLDQMGEAHKTRPAGGRQYAFGYQRGLEIPLDPWLETPETPRVSNSFQPSD